MSSTQKKETFKAVISARSSSTAPSELEVLLREYCHRLTVKESLKGAHFVIVPPAPPSTSSSLSTKTTSSGPVTPRSIAVRFYSPKDIHQLTSAGWIGNDSTTNQEMKVLQQFSSSFALSLVFFVLPEEDQTQPQNTQLDQSGPTTRSSRKSFLSTELDNPKSFTRRAMDLLTTGLQQQQQQQQRSQSNKCCRFMVVPNAKTAVEGIQVFMTDPIKEARKKAYFQKQEVRYCIPSPPHAKTGDQENSNSNKTKHQREQEKQERVVATSQHVRQVLTDWARRFEIPPGEEDILFQMAGNLKSIATLGSNATLSSELPIESLTRNKLQAFFELSGPSKNHHNEPDPNDAGLFSDPQENFSNYPMPHEQHHESHQDLQQQDLPQQESTFPVPLEVFEPPMMPPNEFDNGDESLFSNTLDDNGFQSLSEQEYFTNPNNAMQLEPIPQNPRAVPQQYHPFGNNGGPPSASSWPMQQRAEQRGIPTPSSRHVFSYGVPPSQHQQPPMRPGNPHLHSMMGRGRGGGRGGYPHRPGSMQSSRHSRMPPPPHLRQAPSMRSRGPPMAHLPPPRNEPPRQPTQWQGNPMTRAPSSFPRRLPHPAMTQQPPSRRYPPYGYRN